MDLSRDLEHYRAETIRNRQNRGGPATVHAKFSSTGTGSVEFTDEITFDLTFIEEPWLSYGAGLDTDDLRDLLDLGGDDDVALPLATGYVVEWDQDENDYYVGAYVAVRVWFPVDQIYIPPDIKVELNHYFTFAGRAIKNVPITTAGP